MTTLATIRTKVRRLTARLTSAEITDAQIDEYINTFYLYDVPETLRLNTLQTTFEFLTEANVDQYDLSTLTVETSSGTMAAQDVYVTLSPPIYIAGYQSFWSQSPEQFFTIYPKLAQIDTTVTGDGTPGPYTFTFPNVPVFQNSVTVGAIDSTGATVQVVDSPQNRTTANWVIVNTTTSVTGTFDYISGAGSITFSNNIPSGNEITITGVPYAANRPQAVLYYSNTLTLRPVPDKVYPVTLLAYQTPSALLENGDSPELKQWWQYLAYGAAKKIFEDSQDPDGVAAILPEFRAQEAMVLRRTLVQNAEERSATIYSEQTGIFAYGNFNSWL